MFCSLNQTVAALGQPWPRTVPDSTLWDNCLNKQAYYTAITQTDAQVGRVLDELDSLGCEQSTIVVISADRE